MENDILIELKNIKKVYDQDTLVVEDFNLEIKKGEFVTLLGPSGCGKTTILRMLGGFDKPTEGTILLDGVDITDLAPNQRPINTVFQKYALFPHLNVYDNVAFGLKLKNMTKFERDKKVRKVLELVDLEGFEKRSIHTLSGGQQQRIAIARAIVNEPDILLCDEATSALDPETTKTILGLLKTIHDTMGITVVIITHEMKVIQEICTSVAVLENGEVQEVSSVTELFANPKSKAAKRLLLLDGKEEDYVG